MKTKIIALFMGIVIGGTMFGSDVAHAVTEHLRATPSPNAIYVDGKLVQLEAYAINGHNYVKLRDIGRVVGFNVYWNGTVQIDSDEPYTGEPSQVMQEPVDGDKSFAETDTITAAHWSREDFSQQADPSVFTGPYTRELYNTIRQTMLDGDVPNATGYRYAYTMVSAGNYSAVKNLLGRMEGVLRYQHHVPAGLTNYYQYPDYFAVSAQMPENFQDAYRFILPVIEQANRYSSDREKVTYLNDYLKSLLLYDSSATAGITQIFCNHETELKAACGSYARAFNFLCSAVGIPCITIKTNTHGWNLVYADGAWLHVDVSTNDLTAGNRILLVPSIANRIDTAPEATAFLKELLVPGSTK